MSDTTTQTPTAKLPEFPAVSYDEWRKLVESELKGAPFEKRMFTPTHEGITLKPIYRKEDIAGLRHVNTFPGFAPFVRGTEAAGYVKQPWDISQEIAYSSPTEFNNAARNSLSRGLDALNMVLDRATRNGNDPDWAQAGDVGFGGLSIATLRDLDRALEGVDLTKITLLVRSGASGMPFAALLVALARRRKQKPAGLRGCIEMDPLGVLSHEGHLPQSMDCAYREMACLTKWAADNAPMLQTICVHSRAWHEAGGNAVQELAFTLASGVEYLREMQKRDLDVNTVAPRIRFAITTGSNFFMEIAKLRALRMLWSRAVGAAGGNEEAQKLSLHTRTSQWNKSTRDAHSNIVRSTVEAFAGVLGGCQSMQVGAFDEVARLPDDFSQRIARNTQLILQKECDLNRVIDPAGGSWMIESLTADLAKRAWAVFQEVEKLGGMQAALHAGFPQAAVAATAGEKIQAVARRRESIVGVNQYANAKEKPLETPDEDAAEFQKRRAQQVASHRTSLDDVGNEIVLEKLSNIVSVRGAGLFEECLEAVTAGATLGEIVRAIRIHDRPCAPITPVAITRAAAPFEKLRAAADRFAATSGKRPRVFLCNMGKLRDYKARADFAGGFFSAGGYEVISPTGFADAAAAAAAYVASEAEIAVICSTDENYPAVVGPLAAAIREKRPKAVVVLAGYPTEQVEAHRKAGVDEFIHIRADAAELLANFHERLGVV